MGFPNATLLKGSWDLVTRVIPRVAILITPIKVPITLLTKSHEPPSNYEDSASHEQNPFAEALLGLQ